LTREAAQRLGVEWIDMSKIGVPGLGKQARVSDPHDDPMRWVVPTHDPLIQLVDASYPVVVNFWRLVSPGIWVWEADDAVFPEGITGPIAKHGATYTAFYPGCEKYPPQFLGGFAGETPPEGVLTFTVDAGTSRWEYDVFELFKELKTPEPPKPPDPPDPPEPKPEPIPNPRYALSVVGSYADSSGTGRYLAGETVVISAGTRPGYVFAGWQSSGGVAFANASASTTTVTMPASRTTVTATWSPAAQYRVVIIGGGIGDMGAGDYQAGATVAISAGRRLLFEFAGWTAIGNVTFADPSAETTTFTMPPGGVVVIATWRLKGTR
jgi:uncharacterized repeat protein (TIGR02543 family)